MRIIIKKESLYYFLMLIPFFFPATFASLLHVGTIIKFLKILVGILVILQTIEKHRISFYLMIVIGFYVIICISAILHGLQFDNWLIDIVFILFINFLTCKKKSLICFLKVYVSLYTFMILINLGTMLLFPNGLYATTVYEMNWFLGYKNVIVRFLIPYITMYFTLKKLNNNTKLKLEKKDIFILIVVIVSVLISHSFNSIIGLVVYVILFFRLGKRKNLPNYIISKSFALYCILDLMLLKFNITALFKNFIVNVLERNSSEAARIAIWNRTIDLISKSPAIGYGGIENEMYNFTFNISHPHNLLLYYLMLAGVVGILLFFVAIIYVERAIQKQKDEQIKYVYQLFAISYIAFFSMGFMESLTGAVMFVPMLIVLYNVNEHYA